MVTIAFCTVSVTGCARFPIVVPAAGDSGRGVVTDPVRDESTAAVVAVAVGEAGVLLLQADASNRLARDAAIPETRQFMMIRS